MSRTDWLPIGLGMIYLAATGWAMQALSYDLWGALIVIPPLALASAPLIRRAFPGDLAVLRPIVWIGLCAKLAGSVAGYYIRFDSYGGSADASRYHNVGKVLAGNVRSGLSSPLTVFPRGQSTDFIEQLTGLIYTIIGSSRLGGFMVFTWMSFWGLVFFLKAGIVAVHGVARQRYAVMLFLFPSLVYWGSSIGKEAVVGLFLGVATYGVAILLIDRDRGRFGASLAITGLFGAAYIRPHFGAIWAGGLMVALLVRLVLDITGRAILGAERQRVQLGTVVMTLVAVAGFVLVANITLNYFDPAGQDEPQAGAVTDRVTAIFDEVEGRTTKGGSSFEPINVDSPRNWPHAAYRTITRPLLTEASGLSEMLPATEMTALLALGLISWRRLLHAPKLLFRAPYLVFALLCVFTFGVAFATIGNLGILTRQRSLILPLVLLFWCLPPLRSQSGDTESAPAPGQTRTPVAAGR